MKRFFLLAICFFIAAIGIASATTGPWYQNMFGHFAATQRYIEYGVATPGINEVYVNAIDDFIPFEDVRTATFCPAAQTGGALTGEWTYFAARMLPVPSNGAINFYAVSYLGSNTGFHGAGMDALVTSADISAGEGLLGYDVPAHGLQAQHTAAFGKSNLLKSSHFAPLSWNSKDIDGDGVGDLAFGGMMYLSSSNYSTPAWSTSQLNAEVAFLDTPNGVRAARLKGGRLSVVRALPVSGFTEEGLLQIDQVQVNAGHTLTAIPGPAGDRIMVRRSCGLQVYNFTGTSIIAGPCINGLLGNWAMPGGVGDFDGDGFDDVWIAETNQGDANAPANSRVTLISGALLNAAFGSVTLDSLKIARINGSARYSNYDGIGTTMSPKAGDFDGDGMPDFSFSGHRHMSEAGALFILPGSEFVSSMNIALTDPRLIKVVGKHMSQLAPPYHHWDATDLNGDGHDDIVVSAVNDLCSGLNAGAIYVLSGKAIADH